MNLDRKSGQAFSDHETSTKGRRLDFHSGKTVDQPIPSLETGDSPRSASAGERPQKKRGVGIFFSRRESALLGNLLGVADYISWSPQQT